MAASDVLEDALNEIEEQKEAQKAGIGAAGTMQVQQAVQQGAQAPKAQQRGLGQQLATGVTQQTGQQALQAEQKAAQVQLQEAGQQIKTKQGAEQLDVRRQALAAEEEIAIRQREGLIRQNSLELRQAKALNRDELAQRERLQQTGIEYENEISFLTRKQREDLADLGRFTKQQIFDSRLQFQLKEGQRKFSNARQLADYAVASAESDDQLKRRLAEMDRAFRLETMALEAAHEKIVRRMELEFQRAERTKDYDNYKQIAKMEQAMKEKIRRKKAQAAATNSIIVGAATIAGAAVAGPPGALAANQAAQGAGSGAGPQSDVEGQYP